MVQKVRTFMLSRQSLLQWKLTQDSKSIVKYRRSDVLSATEIPIRGLDCYIFLSGLPHALPVVLFCGSLPLPPSQPRSIMLCLLIAPPSEHVAHTVPRICVLIPSGVNSTHTGLPGFATTFKLQ